MLKSTLVYDIILLLCWLNNIVIESAQILTLTSFLYINLFRPLKIDPCDWSAIENYNVTIIITSFCSTCFSLFILIIESDIIYFFVSAILFCVLMNWSRYNSVFEVKPIYSKTFQNCPRFIKFGCWTYGLKGFLR